MTAPTPKILRTFALDRRYFAAFLVFQGAVVAGSIFVFEFLPALLIGALCVAFFVAGLLLRPWIIAPILLLTTGLDSTGRLFGESGPSKEIFLLTGFHLAFGLMVAGLAANICLRQRVHFPDFEIKVPLFLFLASIAVSLTYTPNQLDATVSFLRICALVLFTYMVQITLDSRRAVSAVLWSLVVLTIAGSVMGAYQVITGQFHLPAKVITALGGNVPRATGAFHNPNIFASFVMSGVLPLLAVLLNYRLPRGQRMLFALSVVIGIGGLLASFSRSSWVSTLVGVLVILWLSGKLRYFFIGVFAFILLVFGLKEFVPYAEYIFERLASIFTLFDEFGSTGRASSTARIYLVIASLDMFADHPFLGTGWRSFPVIFSQYAPPGYPHWTLVKEPHTIVTAILGELGIVGFAAFVWFVGKTFFLSLGRLQQMQDSYLRAIAIGLIATFVAFQVNQTFNGDLPSNMFWFYIGMLFAVQRLDADARAP